VSLQNRATIISQGLGAFTVENAGVSVVAKERLEISGDSQLLGFGADGAGVLLRAPEVVLDGSVVGRPTAIVRGLPEIDAEGNIKKDADGNIILVPVEIAAAPGSGDISLEADRLVLQNGATLEGSTSSGLRGGRLSITARDEVVLMGAGTGIRSATTGIGEGGEIRVLSPTVSLLDGAEISASASGAGRAGEITVDGQRVTVRNRSEIAARSTGLGDAGSVRVRGLDAIQLRDSSVTTEALQGSGGNISLESDRLIELRRSSVTASVTSGSGGNITIDPTFVILDEGSRIIAQAREGSGGNIRITADVLLVSLDSEISASSQRGVNGTVAINSPETNIAGTLSALPASFFDGAALLRQRCAQRTEKGAGSFVVASASGITASPDAPLAAISSARKASAPEETLAGMVLGQDGEGRTVGLLVACESGFESL